MKEFKDKLESLNSVLNLSVFEEKTSLNRGMMFSGASKQSVVPINPDLPIIMSSLAVDLSESTEKVTAKTDIKVLKRIEKYIDGKKTHVTFILYIEEGVLKCHEHKAFRDVNEGFGEKIIDHTENVVKIKKDGVLFEPHGYDTSGYYRLGKNVTAMYATGLNCLEDQVVISEELMNELSVYKVTDIMVEIDPDNLVIKNIYGSDGLYKPFPNVGEYVRDDQILMALSKESSRHAFLINDEGLREIFTVDEKIIVPFKKAQVVDITVRIGEPTCPNEYLDHLRHEQNRYENDKIEAIEELWGQGYTLSDELKIEYNKLKIICDCKWKNADSDYSPKIILLTITLVGEKFISLSQKVTGTYGNKGVVGRVLSNNVKVEPRERMPFTEDGRRIDIILNTISVCNRNIIGQVYYLHMANLSYQLQEALKKLDISNKEKYEILRTTIAFYSEHTAKVYDDTVKEFGLDAFMNYTLYEDKIRFIIDPMSNNIGLKNCLEAKRYLTSKGIKTGAVKVSTAYGELFETEVGEMYLLFLKQSNESSSSSSIRSLGSFTDKGDPSKTQVYKENRSRYPDTPVKMSETDFYLLLSKLGKGRVLGITSRSENQILESFRAITTSLGYVICDEDEDVYGEHKLEEEEE